MWEGRHILDASKFIVWLCSETCWKISDNCVLFLTAASLFYAASLFFTSLFFTSLFYVMCISIPRQVEHVGRSSMSNHNNILRDPISKDIEQLKRSLLFIFFNLIYVYSSSGQTCGKGITLLFYSCVTIGICSLLTNIGNCKIQINM